MIDVKLRGVLRNRSGAPQMRAQKPGHVVTTAGVAGQKVPASAVYSAARTRS
jgi:NADP-dependent 3-hydroxy acid dehydrogenase YdfG